MYHDVTPRTMWEVEPTLYWRVKEKNGKWAYRRAKWIRYPRHPNDLLEDKLLVIAAEYPVPEGE